MSAELEQVGEADWQERVGLASIPVLVDFWAPWCVPCVAASRLACQVARREGGRLGVVGVDVDAQPALAARHAVLALPTLILFVGGREVGRLDGSVRAKRLDSLLAAHLDHG